MERIETIRGVLSQSGSEKPVRQLRYLIPLIVVLAALSLPLWLTPEQVAVKSLGVTEFLKLLASPLLIALLLERSLEVFVTTWRGAKATDLSLEVKHSKDRITKLRELEKAEPGKREADLTTAVAALEQARQMEAAHKCQTKQFALWAALTLGILVSAVGIRTLQPLIEADALSKLAEVQMGSLRIIDVLLTGGLIAGGSEGIHKFTQVYKDSMQITSDNIKSRRVEGG